MEKKGISLRLDAGLLKWADAQAAERKVSRTDVIEGALRALIDGPADRGLLPPRPAEKVLSPAQTGTAHWREPSEEEVQDTRERFAREYPERGMLPPERLMRLARAEARARDQGRLPKVGEKVGRDEPRPVESNGSKPEVREDASFDRLTFRRAKFFQGLNTRPPDGVTQGKGDKPRGAA